MNRYQHIVVLTGAGLSAESGLSTFRDKGGIWSKYDYRDVATPEGFARDPGLVLDFYNQRRQGHAHVAPNAAHVALARLEREHPGEVVIVTQNIDALHEAAGSQHLIHMHGELLKARCDFCRTAADCRGDLGTASACPGCGAVGGLRPDVVWFGEMPFETDRIYQALESCDLFVSIGTSGSVYPAAGFVQEARLNGVAHTVELNLEPSEGITLFHEAAHGPATEVVPAFVDRVLRDGW